MVDPDGCELQIAAWDTTVVGNSADVGIGEAAVATDEPLWLQLRIDDDAIAHWEWSTDGDVWQELHAEPSACDVESAWSAVFAGAAHQEPGSLVRGLESFERCEAP